MSITGHLFVAAVGLHGVVEHDHAEGTGRGDDVGAGVERLVGALHVHAFADGLFHPHARATGPAAEAPLAAPSHLDGPHARYRVEHVARFVEDPVVATQVARVVIRHGALVADAGHEFAGGDEMAQQLRVVDHLEVAAQTGVLVLHRVEAVRAARDDLLCADVVQRGDVDLGHLLEEVLVAHPSRRVTGAGLAGAEDAEAHAGAVQHARGGDRLLATALVERSGAADPVEVLDVLGDRTVDDRHFEVQRVQPLGALGRAQPPRVALILHVAQQQRGLGREARLHHHLVAAHVDDGVDVLDVDRALLDAAAARGARPQDVRIDRGRHERRHVGVGPSGKQPIGRGEHVVAQPHDEQLRTEGLAGRPRRADRLTASALGAGGEVQHLLPGEVLHLARAEDRVLGDVVHVHVRRLVQSTQGSWSTRHADVDGGEEDVQVLGVRDEDEESGDHRDVEQQEDRLEDGVDSYSERRQPAGDDLAGERPRRRERQELTRRRDPVRIAVHPPLRVNGKCPVSICAAAIQQERDDDHRDHEQHGPRRAEVAAVEARLAFLTRRRVLDADDGEHHERDQHRRGEEVLGEAQPVVASDQGNVEVAIEQRPVRLEDRRHQYGESPHGEEVRQAGHGPLEKFSSDRRPRRLRSRRPCGTPASDAEPVVRSESVWRASRNGDRRS